MARRKNTKRIDPRYFLNETTHRDLEEQQTGQLPTIKVDALNNNTYAQIAGATPRQVEKHPIFKVPNENLYFQLRPMIYTVNGKNEQYGFRLHRGTTPRDINVMISSLDKRNQEDVRSITNVATWMASIISKSGHDQLEIVDDPEKEIKRMGYRS